MNRFRMAKSKILFLALVAVILSSGLGGGYMLGTNLREIAGL